MTQEELEELDRAYQAVQTGEDTGPVLISRDALHKLHAAISSAVEAERERCAAIADKGAEVAGCTPVHEGAYRMAKMIAEKIRGGK